jgi:hypothetical protein
MGLLWMAFLAGKTGGLNAGGFKILSRPLLRCGLALAAVAASQSRTAVLPSPFTVLSSLSERPLQFAKHRQIPNYTGGKAALVSVQFL